MPRFAACAVIILMAFSAAAGPQLVDQRHPAEHRASKALSRYCLDCHVCDTPTRTDPCLGICPRHGGHFFSEHIPAEGPHVVVIDQLAELYQPVLFSHELHATMSNLSGGCTNCHHYSEETGDIPPCRKCHGPGASASDLRQPSLKAAYHRQCMGCHRDWSHENACGFCHEPAAEGAATKVAVDRTDIVGIGHPLIHAEPFKTYSTSYEPAPLVTFHHRDHVDLFGLACVDCHRGETCGRCHDESRPRRTVNHLTACGSCHRERACDFCHANVVKGPFDHATSVGWSLEPYHRRAACVDCHGPVGTFRSPSNACRSCHIHWAPGSFDHRITGLVLSETHRGIECEACHANEEFSKRPACGECHDDKSFPQQQPGTRR